MNRRKALGRIFLIGGGGVAAFTGYKSIKLLKTPNLGYLQQQQQVIGILADLIIPQTNTPGAKQAAIVPYIIKAVTDCTIRSSQNTFIEGLKDIQQYTLSKYDKALVDCSRDQQVYALKHFEETGQPYRGIMGKVQKRYLGESFFTTLKRHVVEGFCTSKVGATQALVYDYVPGKYNGCMPLQPGQRAWATN